MKYPVLAAKIEAILADKKLTLSKVAQESGMGYHALRNYKLGFSRPNNMQRKVLCTYLGIDPQYLMNENIPVTSVDGAVHPVNGGSTQVSNSGLTIVQQACIATLSDLCKQGKISDRACITMMAEWQGVGE